MKDLIITGKKMMWHEAIDYARSKNMWIPTRKQAKDIKGLDVDFWTSTTNQEHTAQAYYYKSDRPDSKTLVKDVVMVKELKGVDTDLSFRSGDIIDW